MRCPEADAIDLLAQSPTQLPNGKLPTLETPITHMRRRPEDPVFSKLVISPVDRLQVNNIAFHPMSTFHNPVLVTEHKEHC